MRVDPNYVRELAGSIGQSSAQEQRLSAELSSGLRVQTLSDDAGAAARNVLLAGAIRGSDTFVQTATREQSLLQVTDSTLGEVVARVTQAVSLGVSATNGTLSAANVSALARQVSDIRDNVVGLANTSFLGEYVFAGSQGGTQPFTLDKGSDPAVAMYHGDGLTQGVVTPDGQRIAVNLGGGEIFAAAGADLLGALNALASDLGGGRLGAVAGDTAALTKALTNVSVKRSGLDGSLARLNAAATYAGTQGAEFRAQQSALLSADPAQVATDLKTADVQRQSLFSVIATLGKNNLFDYLK